MSQTAKSARGGKLCPFSWYGGKFSHLKWLLPIIEQTPHACYVEPFGGSASVILNKKPSNIEVYNDIYSEVVNFFRVLREQKDELIEQLRLTLYSREEFAQACQCSDNENSPLELARLFFVRARQVRSGLASVATPGNWSYTRNESRRGIAHPISRWLSAIDGLEAVCMRLKEIQIENVTYQSILERYDTPDTLFYLDPPYLPETRSGGRGYQHEMTREQHEQLLTTIKDLQGKVILSGYASELYAGALGDWHTYKQGAALVPSNNYTSTREEVIWTNYPLAT